MSPVEPHSESSSSTDVLCSQINLKASPGSPPPPAVATTRTWSSLDYSTQIRNPYLLRWVKYTRKLQTEVLPEIHGGNLCWCVCQARRTSCVWLWRRGIEYVMLYSFRRFEINCMTWNGLPSAAASAVWFQEYSRQITLLMACTGDLMRNMCNP